MKRLLAMIGVAAIFATLAASALAAVAYDERTIALIETRPCDIADRTREWIETRLGDTDTGLATIDTAKPLGLTLSFR